jgi:hypothetical protein
VDGKLGTFLLGVIAAVVLFMLWKDDKRGTAFQFPQLPMGVPPSMNPGCSSCGYGTPAYSTSPSLQTMLAFTGTDGMIGPPGVPLNSPAGGQGATSFYTNAGVTPDTTFTFFAVPRNTNPLAVGSPVQPGGLQGNVPGSPTTIAAVTPVRATQAVPPFQVGGFVQHYNIVGVPLSVLQGQGYLV